MTYVALLRGINVGGNNKIKMADLRILLSNAGFLNVKTILASGNIILESKLSADECKAKIEKLIAEEFTINLSAIVLPHSEVRKLVAAEPFKNTRITPSTRLYVTFLPNKIKPKLKAGFKSETEGRGSFQILQVTPTAVCSVLTLARSGTTLDLMNFLDKQLGKQVTTRNWNTVLKLLN